MTSPMLSGKSPKLESKTSPSKEDSVPEANLTASIEDLYYEGRRTVSEVQHHISILESAVEGSVRTTVVQLHDAFNTARAAVQRLSDIRNLMEDISYKSGQAGVVKRVWKGHIDEIASNIPDLKATIQRFEAKLPPLPQSDAGSGTKSLPATPEAGRRSPVVAVSSTPLIPVMLPQEYVQAKAMMDQAAKLVAQIEAFPGTSDELVVSRAMTQLGTVFQSIKRMEDEARSWKRRIDEMSQQLMAYRQTVEKHKRGPSSAGVVPAPTIVNPAMPPPPAKILTDVLVPVTPMKHLGSYAPDSPSVIPPASPIFPSAPPATPIGASAAQMSNATLSSMSSFDFNRNPYPSYPSPPARSNSSLSEASAQAVPPSPSGTSSISSSFDFASFGPTPPVPTTLDPFASLPPPLAKPAPPPSVPSSGNSSIDDLFQQLTTGSGHGSSTATNQQSSRPGDSLLI
eukprot:CAMPEP_0184648048 /NCGR_PEP_ID=MMETSP0308-20130426/5116_1 /TAXON_ID=38269 /ORGANISM="Gloeochaete witrockiana, Strain SAG 46.84" /LENGTH=454 /DNA_ID=CAMNT_0027079565 /DNA_START=40 /DNA_END=1404 /DNA_ORIENTATION=-